MHEENGFSLTKNAKNKVLFLYDNAFSRDEMLSIFRDELDLTHVKL